MTDREILEILLEKVTSVDKRLENVEERLDRVEDKLTDTRLHIENVTDKNIQLLAERHELFVSKYSKVEEVSDKQFAYYVKVNNMIAKMAELEKEIEKLKNRTA